MRFWISRARAPRSRASSARLLARISRNWWSCSRRGTTRLPISFWLCSPNCRARSSRTCWASCWNCSRSRFSASRSRPSFSSAAFSSLRACASTARPRASHSARRSRQAASSSVRRAFSRSMACSCPLHASASWQAARRACSSRPSRSRSPCSSASLSPCRASSSSSFCVVSTDAASSRRSRRTRPVSQAPATTAPSSRPQAAATHACASIIPWSPCPDAARECTQRPSQNLRRALRGAETAASLRCPASWPRPSTSPRHSPHGPGRAGRDAMPHRPCPG
ncbi:MAG: hypothetical protein KatS3mg126_2058 [Lysobacteraceae bacterium]|nr:MAG: hypothetical protein KatS3mg126_2058 [Xanthomonadaceae bacterium]